MFVYYSVKEVNGKENFILDYLLFFDFKLRKRKLKLGGKELRYIDGLIGGKGNKVVRILYSYKVEKRENFFLERLFIYLFLCFLIYRKVIV